jgi:hypothetical protein
MTDDARVPLIAALTAMLPHQDTGAFPPPRVPGHVQDRIASGADPGEHRGRRRGRRPEAPRAAT